MKLILKNNKNRGFTIIETMIAIALFSIVVTVGMGALLNANLIHKKSQDMRSIMDNLSFIMEDMSRNLRTGYNYSCMGGATSPDCASGGTGISFTSADGVSHWVYMIDSYGNIQKSIDSGTTWTQLNSSEINLSSASGFKIIGAEPLPSDAQQPFVTIKLVGKITYKGVDTSFSLQTSVSQRLIDI